MQVTLHRDMKVRSWAADAPASTPMSIPVCESWQQAMQYVDERPVVQVLSQICLAEQPF